MRSVLASSFLTQHAFLEASQVDAADRCSVLVDGSSKNASKEGHINSSADGTAEASSKSSELLVDRRTMGMTEEYAKSVSLPTKVLDRYPKQNYVDHPLDVDALPGFCFPLGANVLPVDMEQFKAVVGQQEHSETVDTRLQESVALKCRQVDSYESHHFVMTTETGERTHASCVTFYEPVTDVQLRSLTITSPGGLLDVLELESEKSFLRIQFKEFLGRLDANEHTTSFLVRPEDTHLKDRGSAKSLLYFVFDVCCALLTCSSETEEELLIDLYNRDIWDVALKYERHPWLSTIIAANQVELNNTHETKEKVRSLKHFENVFFSAWCILEDRVEVFLEEVLSAYKIYQPVALVLASPLQHYTLFTDVLVELLHLSKQPETLLPLDAVSTTHKISEHDENDELAESKAVDSWTTQRALQRKSGKVLPIPLERIILHIVSEIPEPPPGKLNVVFKLHWGHPRTFKASKPALNRLPLLDVPLRPLFESLSTQNLLLLFSALTLERRIVISSKNLLLLSRVCIGLPALLFPLRWESPFIPILPTRLLSLTNAPIPFVFGLHRSSIPRNRFLDCGCVFVCLDSNVVEIPLGAEIPQPPPNCLSKLVKGLKKQVYGEKLQPIPKHPSDSSTHSVNGSFSTKPAVSLTRRLSPNDSTSMAAAMPLIPGINNRSTLAGFSSEQTQNKSTGSNTNLLVSRSSSNPVYGSLFTADTSEFNSSVRELFLKYFVDLLKDYKFYMNGMNAEENDLFNKTEFIQNHPEKNIASEYLLTLLNTQMMQMFFEERIFLPKSNFEIMFFDAWISKEKRKQEMNRTNFLQDSSQKTVTDYIVKSPHPEEYSPMTGFHLKSSVFLSSFDWSVINQPVVIDKLHRLRRGSHLLKNIKKVSLVLEAVYLSFYTKRTLFGTRFKFTLSQVKAGLNQLLNLSTALNEIKAAFKTFRNRIPETSASDGPLTKSSPGSSFSTFQTTQKNNRFQEEKTRNQNESRRNERLQNSRSPLRASMEAVSGLTSSFLSSFDDPDEFFNSIFWPEFNRSENAWTTLLDGFLIALEEVILGPLDEMIRKLRNQERLIHKNGQKWFYKIEKTKFEVERLKQKTEEVENAAEGCKKELEKLEKREVLLEMVQREERLRRLKRDVGFAEGAQRDRAEEFKAIATAATTTMADLDVDVDLDVERRQRKQRKQRKGGGDGKMSLESSRDLRSFRSSASISRSHGLHRPLQMFRTLTSFDFLKRSKHDRALRNSKEVRATKQRMRNFNSDVTSHSFSPSPSSFPNCSHVSTFFMLNSEIIRFKKYKVKAKQRQLQKKQVDLLTASEKNRLDFAEKVARLNRELINFTESLSNIFRDYMKMEAKRITRLKRLLQLVTDLVSDLTTNLQKSIADSLGVALKSGFLKRNIERKISQDFGGRRNQQLDVKRTEEQAMTENQVKPSSHASAAQETEERDEGDGSAGIEQQVCHESRRILTQDENEDRDRDGNGDGNRDFDEGFQAETLVSVRLRGLGAEKEVFLPREDLRGVEKALLEVSETDEAMRARTARQESDARDLNISKASSALRNQNKQSEEEQGEMKVVEVIQSEEHGVYFDYICEGVVLDFFSDFLKFFELRDKNESKLNDRFNSGVEQLKKVRNVYRILQERCESKAQALETLGNSLLQVFPLSSLSALSDVSGNQVTSHVDDETFREVEPETEAENWRSGLRNRALGAFGTFGGFGASGLKSSMGLSLHRRPPTTSSSTFVSQNFASFFSGLNSQNQAGNQSENGSENAQRSMSSFSWLKTRDKLNSVDVAINGVKELFSFLGGCLLTFGVSSVTSNLIKLSKEISSLLREVYRREQMKINGKRRRVEQSRRATEKAKHQLEKESLGFTMLQQEIKACKLVTYRSAVEVEKIAEEEFMSGSDVMRESEADEKVRRVESGSKLLKRPVVPMSASGLTDEVSQKFMELEKSSDSQMASWMTEHGEDDSQHEKIVLDVLAGMISKIISDDLSEGAETEDIKELIEVTEASKELDEQLKAVSSGSQLDLSAAPPLLIASSFSNHALASASASTSKPEVEVEVPAVKLSRRETSEKRSHRKLSPPLPISSMNPRLSFPLKMGTFRSRISLPSVVHVDPQTKIERKRSKLQTRIELFRREKEVAEKTFEACKQEEARQRREYVSCLESCLFRFRVEEGFRLLGTLRAFDECFSCFDEIFERVLRKVKKTTGFISGIHRSHAVREVDGEFMRERTKEKPGSESGSLHRSENVDEINQETEKETESRFETTSEIVKRFERDTQFMETSSAVQLRSSQDLTQFEEESTTRSVVHADSASEIHHSSEFDERFQPLGDISQSFSSRPASSPSSLNIVDEAEDDVEDSERNNDKFYFTFANFLWNDFELIIDFFRELKTELNHFQGYVLNYSLAFESAYKYLFTIIKKMPQPDFKHLSRALTTDKMKRRHPREHGKHRERGGGKDGKVETKEAKESRFALISGFEAKAEDASEKLKSDSDTEKLAEVGHESRDGRGNENENLNLDPFEDFINRLNLKILSDFYLYQMLKQKFKVLSYDFLFLKQEIENIILVHVKRKVTLDACLNSAEINFKMNQKKFTILERKLDHAERALMAETGKHNFGLDVMGSVLKSSRAVFRSFKLMKTDEKFSEFSENGEKTEDGKRRMRSMRPEKGMTRRKVSRQTVFRLRDEKESQYRELCESEGELNRIKGTYDDCLSQILDRLQNNIENYVSSFSALLHKFLKLQIKYSESLLKDNPFLKEICDSLRKDAEPVVLESDTSGIFNQKKFRVLQSFSPAFSTTQLSGRMSEDVESSSIIASTAENQPEDQPEGSTAREVGELFKPHEFFEVEENTSTPSSSYNYHVILRQLERACFLGEESLKALTKRLSLEIDLNETLIKLTDHCKVFHSPSISIPELNSPSKSEERSKTKTKSKLKLKMKTTGASMRKILTESESSLCRVSWDLLEWHRRVLSVRFESRKTITLELISKVESLVDSAKRKKTVVMKIGSLISKSLFASRKELKEAESKLSRTRRMFLRTLRTKEVNYRETKKLKKEFESCLKRYRVAELSYKELYCSAECEADKLCRVYEKYEHERYLLLGELYRVVGKTELESCKEIREWNCRGVEKIQQVDSVKDVQDFIRRHGKRKQPHSQSH